MRSLVPVYNANCTYCMGDAQAMLLARPLVHAVRISGTAGCVEVEHDNDDLPAITNLLQQSRHGWEVGSNGDVDMTPAVGESTAVCAIHAGSKQPQPNQ
jgi:hypothetical protein